MRLLTREQVEGELLAILKDIRDDWDSSIEVTEKTGIFQELGFESIDAVALGSTLEEHFDQSLPFAEYLTKVREQQLKDITVGHILTFLMENLKGSVERKAS